MQERGKSLPQQLNICTSVPSVWTPLGPLCTHGPIAAKRHARIGLAWGGLGVGQD